MACLGVAKEPRISRDRNSTCRSSSALEGQRRVSLECCMLSSSLFTPSVGAESSLRLCSSAFEPDTSSFLEFGEFGGQIPSVRRSQRVKKRWGSLTPVFNRWIPIPASRISTLAPASTPLILHKSRMRRRARTDPSAGRSVMSVPTGTTEVRHAYRRQQPERP